MFDLTNNMKGACFRTRRIKKDFEGAIRTMQRANFLKPSDLLLIETYEGNYFLYEFSQVARFNACGISFYHLNSNVENYVDYTTIKLLSVLRFKKQLSTSK